MATGLARVATVAAEVAVAVEVEVVVEVEVAAGGDADPVVLLQAMEVSAKKSSVRRMRRGNVAEIGGFLGRFASSE